MKKSEMILASLITLLAAGAALSCVPQAGLLDGRVTVADSAGLNPPADFTLEAWVRPTEFHFYGDADSSYQEIIYKWGDNNQRSYLLAIYQDQAEFAMTITGTYSNSGGIYSNTHLTLNQWVHIAGVYAGGTMSLFINGEQDPQTVYLPGGAFQGQAPVYICGTTDLPFHGGIDEVRLSDVARYSGTFARPTAEFSPDSHTMLLMHMNEGSGTFTDNIGLLGGDGTLDASSGWGEGAPIAP